MIANFFSKTKPINFLVLAIMIGIIFIIALINVTVAKIDLYFFVKNGFLLFLAVLAVFVMSFIIRKNTLSEDNSYAILFYILLFGFFPNSFDNESIFLSNFVMLFAYRRIYSLRTSVATKEKIFDGAFWIGIASLFYVWSLFYMLLLYAAIWVYRKADWRNVVIPIIGLITPVFLSYTYLLAFDDLERFNNIWKIQYDFSIQNYDSAAFLVPIILIGFVFLISIYPTTKKSLMAKIDFKSTWQLLMAHIIISLIIVLISPLKNGSELTFLFFPLSVVFANFLQILPKYWFKEAVIYLFFITFLTVLF